METDVYIDALWNAFVDTLPDEAQSDARRLALSLGLAPVAGIAWSSVFKHPVTLAAPALIAPALPEVEPGVVRSAILAHLLAIIEAFATDRIEDEQVPATQQLGRLLRHVRAARDRALEAVVGQDASPYPEAERRTLAAINTERQLLRDGAALSFRDYTCLSLAKQAAAFPASLALAGVAGWETRRLQALRRALEGIVLGLQFHDDVIDWEEDWQQGAAWAVSLSSGLTPVAETRIRGCGAEAVRQRVHGSGALGRMLELARRCYRQSARLANALGAYPLGVWAQDQERCVAELAAHEAQHAGYAVRAHQLAAWAAEVLA